MPYGFALAFARYQRRAASEAFDQPGIPDSVEGAAGSLVTTTPTPGVPAAFMAVPRPGYMDYYERIFYNQILASQNPASAQGITTYMVPLTPDSSKEYSNDYDTNTYCHGTGLENYTKYKETIYARSPANSSLYVNLYIPSQLD